MITAGSYEKTGILFRGFERVDDKQNLFLRVGRTTIGAAAAAGAADADAIQFGPILGVGSVGVCSDATSNTIQANKIKDFDVAVSDPCTVAASSPPSMDQIG